ncbi:MAG: S8 family serine peptidase, partial [Bacteroidota bacterium]|nr:S8 family serine peptidase [Bacteroidota bacterium]
MNSIKYIKTLWQKYLSFIVLITILSSTNGLSQLQQFKLQGRDYHLDGKNWYTFFEGKKGDEIIPNRLIVRLKDKGFIENLDFQRLSINGVSMGSARFLDGFYVLSIAPDRDPFYIASALQQSGRFEILEFDAKGKRLETPNDPLFPQQWNLTKIQMQQAWDITSWNSSIILSIIDSGTRYTHEDLDGNIWVNPAEDLNGNGRPDFISVAQGGDLDGLDNDGNSYVDDLVGWDFAGGNNYPSEPFQPDNEPLDTDGHGTNVAGVSSAQTNNYEGGSYRGIAGVAGGWGNQKGVSLMVLRDGGEDPIASLTLQAIEYAARNGARVINISSAFLPEPSGMSTAVNLAVNTYGIIIVASAGNNGAYSDPSIRYPARYSNTIAVGATDYNDNRRSYSAYGPQMDVVAPDGVQSTTMAGGYINSVTGTSFSAPHVAGLAALLRSKVPSLKQWEVRDIIRNSADKVPGMGGNNFTNYYGYGRINIYKALSHPVISQFTQAPNPIYRGNSGSVTCHLSLGHGDITYTWSHAYFPTGSTVTYNGNKANIYYGYSKQASINEYNEKVPMAILTCTAQNDAGSYTLSTPVFFGTYPPSGCPFVYTWNGSEYIEDNNILPQSVYTPPEEGLITDYYQLFKEPIETDRTYKLRVGEFEQEISTLDQFKL